MSENWKIQVSPKLADGTLINLRAEDAAQAEAILKWATENASLITDTVAAFVATGSVTAGLPVASVQSDGPSWSNQGSQQQQAPAQPAGKSCVHGAMVYREAKPGSGKDWKAYFCPTKQGDPSQCKPEFLGR